MSLGSLWISLAALRWISSDYLMKDLELIHLRAARLIHKLPRDMEDETVLINASWMPLKYFYCFSYSKYNT